MKRRHLGMLALFFLGCYESTVIDVTDDQEDVTVTDDEVPFNTDSSMTQPDEEGIFIDQATGSDTTGCTLDLPCRTITRGIELAYSQGKPSPIYVAKGVYREVLDLIRGIRIEGGYRVQRPDEWIRDDSPNANLDVVIEAPSSANVTVYADDIGGEATLARLSVRSKDIANPRESVFGIMARGKSTTLTLEDVSVFTADGGYGPTGKDGAAGIAGSNQGCAGSTDSFRSPRPGGTGADAPPGTFTRDGYIANDGGTGGEGEPGRNGAPPSDTARCFRNCGTCAGFDAADCTTTPDSCGTNGLAGCGGGGGKGGGGGAGAGSSIALYVWDASVSVFGGRLETNSGGIGGDPGAGGPGGTGSWGVQGAPPQSDSCYRCSIDRRAYDNYGEEIIEYRCYVEYIGSGSAGAPGGIGQNGAMGGGGGHGGGGVSRVYYTRDSASLYLEDVQTQSGVSPGDQARSF